MSAAEQSSVKNLLLRALSTDDFRLLRPHLEPVELELRQVLSEPNEATPFVYFLESGLGSVLVGPERTTGVEIGIIGREGLIGSWVALGSDRSPHYCFMQLEGRGWRIAAEQLTRLMDASASLRRLLLLYVQTFLVQVASTAHANADFTVEERLARWILMCHDRADGDQIAITHDFLALMLGVRRPGVTVATHMLEGEHMIRAKRGLITVVDREKLRNKADASYGLAEAEYQQLIGEWPFHRGSGILPFSTQPERI